MSPPNARAPHDAVKLIHLDAARNTGPIVGLEDHVLEQLLVDVLLEHGGHAAQVRQGNRPLLAVGEEPEGLVDLGAVPARVAAAVELERADGKEGFVRRVAVRVGVEDGEELAELGGGRGGDPQGTACLVGQWATKRNRG